MNERLKALCAQAKADIFKDMDAPETTEFGSKSANDWAELYNTRFAELIVKATCNIILHYDNVDEGVAVAKKQLGVEE